MAAQILLTCLWLVLVRLLPVAVAAVAVATTTQPRPRNAVRRLPAEAERWGAMHAESLAKGNIARAKRFFVDMGYTVPSKWREFVDRWSPRIKDTHTAAARKPTGRPPKLSARLIRTVALEWMQKGVGRGDNWRGYSSIAEVRRTLGMTSHPARRCRPLSRPPHLQ